MNFKSNLVWLGIVFGLIWSLSVASADTVLTEAKLKSVIQSFNSGTLAYKQKLYDAADNICQQGIISSRGSAHPYVQGLYRLEALVQVFKKNYPLAESYGQKAVELAIQNGGNGSAEHAAALTDLGRVYLWQAGFKKAQSQLSEAEPILRAQVFQFQNPESKKAYLQVAYSLVTAYAGLGNENAALQVLEPLLLARGYMKPIEYDYKFGLVSGYAEAGEMIYMSGDKDRAQVFFETALGIYHDYKNRAPGRQDLQGRLIIDAPAGITNAYQHLGDIYEQKGRLRESKKLKVQAAYWDFQGHP
jgi:tetratricopeptide (TPR) repeat protein